MPLSIARAGVATGQLASSTDWAGNAGTVVATKAAADMPSTVARGRIQLRRASERCAMYFALR